MRVVRVLFEVMLFAPNAVRVCSDYARIDDGQYHLGRTIHQNDVMRQGYNDMYLVGWSLLLAGVGLIQQVAIQWHRLLLLH